jgi:hypothetical protein
MREKTIRLFLIAAVLIGSLFLGRVLVKSPDIGLAIVAGLVPALVCAWLTVRGKEDSRFLLRLFTSALIVRWLLASLIYYLSLQEFFGGDSITYDAFGYSLSQSWHGVLDTNAYWLIRFTSLDRPGWGMYYFVASIYYVIGQNQFALQLINGALGAGTCVAVYRIAMFVYPEQRVARTAALMTAFAPSMILWSSQALKDAPIVLCLCLCTFYTLKLRARWSLKSFLFLSIYLFCLFALRHYAFYIIFVAIAGTFLFAAKRFTPLKVLQGGLLIIVIGVAFAYFGAGDVAQQTFDFKRIQAGRVWSAKVATSGFGGDVDITDPRAAIGFLPIGIIYVLFAPFPWMVTNLRQLITLPELIAWWALVPMMIRGYWFLVKHRLRESFAICIFIVGLIFAYALYQSNTGTAYRHRAQLYGFFFVFISVGIELRRADRLRRLARAGPPGLPRVPVGAMAGQGRFPMTPRQNRSSQQQG